MASSTKRNRPRLGWPGALGFLISVVLLWWALRGVHAADVIEHVRGARLLPFVACVVTATAVFPLRTVRWRYILRPGSAPPPFVPLWHATAIGFMANNLLPARTGEVARAYSASKMTSIPFTTVAGSLVVERVMDGLMLIVMLTAAAAAGGFSGATTIGGASLGGIIKAASVAFAALLAVLSAMAIWPHAALGASKRVAGILPSTWGVRLVSLVGGLLDGLSILRSPRRFLTVFAWSGVVWGVNGLSFLLAIWAFEFEVPWTAAFVLQSIIAFGVAIPSSPGFFGPFEVATRAALGAYGVMPAAAISYAVSYHLTTFLPITVLGLYSLSRAHLHLSDLRNKTPNPDGQSHSGDTRLHVPGTQTF